MTLRVSKRATRWLFRLSAQIKNNDEQERYEQSTKRRVCHLTRHKISDRASYNGFSHTVKARHKNRSRFAASPS